jgi:hypothetical protein
MAAIADLTTEEVQALKQSWDTATAAHRAYVEARPRTGKICPTCGGAGEIPPPRGAKVGPDYVGPVCVRCDGIGKDPRW